MTRSLSAACLCVVPSNDTKDSNDENLNYPVANELATGYRTKIYYREVHQLMRWTSARLYDVLCR